MAVKRWLVGWSLVCYAMPTMKIVIGSNWNCLHIVQSWVYETEQCLSVCLFHLPAAAACGGFAAVGLAGTRYRSIDARPAQQQHGAAARRAAANAGSATFTADVGS